MHLHGKPRFQSRSAGTYSEYSWSNFCVPEAVANACSRAWLGISARRIHSGRPRWTQRERAGKHLRRAQRAFKGRTHHYFCRRNTVERRTLAAFQERSVLSGEGDWGAVRPGLYLGHRDNDVKRQYAHSSWDGSYHVSRTDQSWRL